LCRIFRVLRRWLRPACSGTFVSEALTDNGGKVCLRMWQRRREGSQTRGPLGELPASDLVPVSVHVPDFVLDLRSLPESRFLHPTLLGTKWKPI
jgi:hypothetical protein